MITRAKRKRSDIASKRFHASSKVVAHALIFSTTKGTFAKQFALAPNTQALDTQICPVKDITLVEQPNGAKFVRALTADGTRMIGKRKLTVDTSSEYGNNQYELWCLSPTSNVLERSEEGSIWDQGTIESLPLFRSDLSATELEGILPAETKKQEWKFDYNSLNRYSKKCCDQNTVMGKTAFSECTAYFDQYAEVLSDESKQILKRSFAGMDEAMQGSQFGLEWLHLKAKSLSDCDPQTVNNLAAGPRHINTHMMVLEEVARQVAVSRRTAEIQGKCTFDIIPNSHILDEGELSFTFKEQKRAVNIKTNLQPRKTYPLFSRESDQMQATLTVNELLNNPRTKVLPVTVQSCKRSRISKG